MSGLSWSERLLGGLKRTSERLGENLSGLTGKSRLDDEDLDRVDARDLARNVGERRRQRLGLVEARDLDDQFLHRHHHEE